MSTLQWLAKKAAYEYFRDDPVVATKEERDRVEKWIYDIYLAVGAPVNQRKVGNVVKGAW